MRHNEEVTKSQMKHLKVSLGLAAVCLLWVYFTVGVQKCFDGVNWPGFSGCVEVTKR